MATDSRAGDIHNELVPVNKDDLVMNKLHNNLTGG